MKVTNDLIFKVLNWLEIPYQNDIDKDYVKLPTVCHEGSSHKLYFYKNSNKLVCFTNCGTLDIFDLISKVKDINKKEAFKIVISNFKVNYTKSNHSVYNPAKKLQTRSIKKNSIDYIDENILKSFYDFRIENWQQDNISYKTQKKFEIKYSIDKNAIIIPHRDYNGNLVGVRQRNMDSKMVDNGIKYVPTYYNGKLLNYPTGQNLYGYYYNKEAINTIHKIVLFEAEKSVMQMDSYYGENNFSVALSGHSISNSQIEFLSKAPVNEIIIALDKDYHDNDFESIKALQKMIIKKYSKLTSRFNVSIIWDNKGLLEYKDSPTDKGKEVFKKLINERKYL